MRDRRTDVTAANRGAFSQVAALTPAREASLRGIAEARAASDLARHIVEAERARDAVNNASVPDGLPQQPGALAPQAGRARSGDLVPIMIGIALGSLALIAFGALAALVGLWR
jgi:hypothetical protein